MIKSSERIINFPYAEISDDSETLIGNICLIDHLGGFDENKSNKVLSLLDQSHQCDKVYWHQFLEPEMKSMYANLMIHFDADLQDELNFNFFSKYRLHPEQKFQSFLCSFNGSDHVGRNLLLAALQRWRYFDPKICSKNLRFTVDKLDGHLGDYFDHDRHRFYRPFFIGHNSERFFDEIYSFDRKQSDHAQNIYNLEHQITASFLHVVSETMATSYYPFVTEKFLYSVVTRGLFLAYAQPSWHDHVERYYGFRKYDKIFDYRFDTIQNPVERLVELMSMISKFSVLSSGDWRDLYEMESETVEYNYDHYFSKRYLDNLKKYE